ncbi:MAG: GTPase HflX [Chloroflexota bacterium]
MKKYGDYYLSEPPAERAFLVGVTIRGSRPLLTVEESLDELAQLADTAGMVVTGNASQTLDHVDPATFIGSGKLQEVKDTIDATGAQVLIFDDELSPRHQREIEKRLEEDIKVLDRSALILDIFAQHARTREGALQVELAQYEYRLPRLTRQWTHLARQAGGGGSRSGNAGVGLRGPGETQLEVDRREIGRRITKLKSDLDLVRQHRSRHRQQRTRAGVPVVSLVGYTNAGKSTLLRALTGAPVLVANQLFATLDPTTRKLEMPSGRQAVITDTVGFIQKLPTTLIAAFRATLEEIAESNVLIHVVDAAHPNVLQHIEAVEDTLAEIEVPSIPKILVWNKIDQTSYDMIEALQNSLSNEQDYLAQVTVSARTGANLDAFTNTIEEALKHDLKRIKLRIPYEHGDIISMLFDSASIEQQEHTADGVVLTVQAPPYILSRVELFEIEG